MMMSSELPVGGLA